VQSYASAVCAAVVCLSIHLFVRHCTKTAIHRITQTTPYDSPGTLVFYAKHLGETPTGSPLRDAK